MWHVYIVFLRFFCLTDPYRSLHFISLAIPGNHDPAPPPLFPVLSFRLYALFLDPPFHLRSRRRVPLSTHLDHIGFIF